MATAPMATSQAAIPFDLKRTMSSGELRPGSSPETTSCSSCTSSQSRTPRSTGSTRSPDSIFACSIESQQTKDGPLEDDVVELARLRPVRADGTDERARLQPFAAQDGVFRGRDRDDDILLGRVAVALTGLGADLLAERAQALLGPAVRDDLLDPGQRLADTRDLALSLPAAADDAECARVWLGQVLGGHAAGGTGAQLAHPVGLDHSCELGLVQVEENDDERRARRKGRVRLEAGQSQLLVDRGHDREHPLAGASPCARTIPDRAARLPLEAGLDRRERIGRREQLLDVSFGQVERQALKPIAASSRRPQGDLAAVGAEAPDVSVYVPGFRRSRRYTWRPCARSSGDRALPCGGRGRMFESCRAHRSTKRFRVYGCLSI